MCVIVLSGDDDEVNDLTTSQNADFSNPSTNIIGKADQPTGRVLLHFDTSKSPINDQGWKYTNKIKQAPTAENDGWEMNFVVGKGPIGMSYPLTSHSSDMLRLGWKLTYIVRPLKGTHHFGFNFTENNNHGWDGRNICLLLSVQKNNNGQVTLSALNSKVDVKTDKSITVSTNEFSNWHTIVIEQKLGTKSGYLTVYIDCKVAFIDKFTRGKGFSQSMHNRLFNYPNWRENKASSANWVIKEIKLETL